MKLGGIDIGTTGCKLTVYSDSGEFLYKSYAEYEASRSTSEHEIDGFVIWQAVKSIIKDTAQNIGNIDAIGVTSFGETFVLLDENDNVLAPCMLYTDPRGTDEAASFDSSLIMKTAGVKPHSMYSLPKLMWIKNNRPDIYEKADKVLLFEDYIVYMLTGVRQIDVSLAARTMALDIKKGEWSREIFDFAGIDIEKMSKVVPSGTVAGKVKEDLSKELGLTDTVIVNACHDQVASATGAGALKSGMAVDGTGTVECVVPIFDKIPENENIYNDNYAVVPFIEKGKYVCYAVSFTGGAAIKWFRDNFAKDLSYKQLDSLIDNTPGDILVVPHFAGAGNPYMDPFSKASFVGVTLGTTRADLYKAVMEGVTYEMLLNLRHLEVAGINPERLIATGGGANSDVWLQMKANILGLPITALDAPEVGSVGTIMLTGVALGAFESVESATKLMVKEKKTYYPDDELHAQHLEIYKKYEKLYSAVRELII